MTPRDMTVDCSDHGPQPATFVCQHLVQSLRHRQPAGFWTSNDPTNPRPDAWCTACETKVQSTGGDWTDESETFAGISLRCGTCYDEVRQMNQSSRMRLGLLALGALAALGLAWLVHPVCMPLSPADVERAAQWQPLEARTDRQLHGPVFQRHGDQWYQCKSWISRRLFF